ncbi:hypothetical protein GpartN1_g1516.t1 [Galdieria partita]|uniref:Uncharacterized protein n=1 Tax=Galdieria partita TaxID=83374 RepID=A0A9C7PSK1_9RHOD|nr:hypothetical protein GpartN1_g1516.t1 [Galdieria partita]
MTLPDNPLAAVQQLLSSLLQNRNDSKGTGSRLKLKTIRELRSRLLSENFRRVLLEKERNNVTSQSQKNSNLEDVSWGSIVRDLVDIIEYNCTTESFSKEKRLSTQTELADTLRAVVRVALEDMWGTDGEGRIFNSLFNDCILNALRFALASLRDNHRDTIHSTMWCLARDILGYSTVLQHLGRKQLAKWYELSFESFKFVEIVDVTFRRLQLTAAQQIVVTLIQRGQLLKLADEILLRKLVMTTIQFLQDLHSFSITDDELASFGISCLFHILCQRGVELDSETLNLIDNVATSITWNLLNERKWQAGAVGYLVVISSLLQTQNCSTIKASYVVTEYSRQCSNYSEEIIEYISHLLSLSDLLGLWQKRELSADYITYLLTFKLQSFSIVSRELSEQFELFDTLYALFETAYNQESSYRSQDDCKRDIFICCFYIVQLISLYTTAFHICDAYRFFHLSTR